MVVPGCPRHVTHRENRRQRTFFEEDDYRTYIELMSQSCGACGVEVWAYCLMPNDVHLIVAPTSKRKPCSTATSARAHRWAARGLSASWKRPSAVCYVRKRAGAHGRAGKASTVCAEYPIENLRVLVQNLADGLVLLAMLA